MTDFIEGKQLNVRETQGREATFSYSIERQIVNALTAEVFDTTPTSIDWRSALKQEIGPYFNTMHTPIAQLSQLYKCGLIPQVPESKYTGRTYSRADITGRSIIREVDMTAKPHEIITLLTQNQLAKETGISKRISTTLKRAKKIMLAGCVELTSAYKLVEALHSLGFNGELDIFDISVAPLKIVDIYKDLFAWDKNYGIKVSTRLMDLRESGGKQTDERYDIVITDVLEHYLSDEDFKRHYPALGTPLRKDGLFLARGMAEAKGIPPETRTVGSVSQSSEPSPEDYLFQKWLQTNFRVTVDIDTIIKDSRLNRWPDTNHPDRFYYQVPMWHVELSRAQLKLRFLSSIVPTGVDPNKRYFQLYVFEKPKGNNNTPHIIVDDEATSKSMKNNRTARAIDSTLKTEERKEK